MTSWQAIWRFAMYELRQERWGLVISLLFYSYLIVIMLSVVGDGRPFDTHTMWLGNFMYITLIPMLGFTMSRTMMRVMSDDSYTHKVAYWRSLPISASLIASSRIVQYLIIFTVGWLYLFTIHFLFIDWMREAGLWTMLGSSLTWYGYGVGIGSSYIIFELGTSGKRYMVVTLLYMIGYVGLTVALYFAQVSLVEGVVGAVDQGAWWLPVLALLAGAAMIAMNQTLIRRRIEHRSFYH